MLPCRSQQKLTTCRMTKTPGREWSFFSCRVLLDFVVNRFTQTSHMNGRDLNCHPHRRTSHPFLPPLQTRIPFLHLPCFLIPLPSRHQFPQPSPLRLCSLFPIVSFILPSSSLSPIRLPWSAPPSSAVLSYSESSASDSPAPILTFPLEQVTRGHNIVANGWAGASNPHPYPKLHSIHKHT